MRAARQPMPDTSSDPAAQACSARLPHAGRWSLRLLLLATCGLPLEALANSQGSPICEVNALPLVPMSPTLANPPPQGWTLQAPARFLPGTPIQLRLHHPDPSRRARGVLIWAKAGIAAGAGTFSVPGDGRWSYIPAPAACGTWALSHTDSQPKTQDQLVFEWTGDGDGSVVVRAFLIEDCSHPAGCRDQQALTPVVLIEAGLFANGFES